jgi:hypothetical protein
LWKAECLPDKRKTLFLFYPDRSLVLRERELPDVPQALPEPELGFKPKRPLKRFKVHVKNAKTTSGHRIDGDNGRHNNWHRRISCCQLLHSQYYTRNNPDRRGGGSPDSGHGRHDIDHPQFRDKKVEPFPS